MIEVHQRKTFLDLSPTEFENFAYDILNSGGMRNLTWRTPGADGGRDLEGHVFPSDFSGQSNKELWYIECKRYSNSLDWPLMYAKVAHADINNADFLLIFTNANPSPACETKITQWNEGRRTPRIRVWRGYELEAIADKFPSVSAKYGLRPPPPVKVGQFLDLAIQISKISQAAYGSLAFGSDAMPALEAASALSELFSLRCEDMARYGHHVPIQTDISNDNYAWLNCQIPGFHIGLGLRALLSTFHFVTRASEVQLINQNGTVTATAVNPRLKLNKSAVDLITIVSIWADIELSKYGSNEITFGERS